MRGFCSRNISRRRSQRLGHAVDDHGTHSEESIDYPPICIAVGAGGRRGPGRTRHRARRQRPGRADRGQQGGRGPRRALQRSLHRRLSREHNDANVLSMGGRIVAFGLADEILTLWLKPAIRRRPPSAPASIRSRRGRSADEIFRLAATTSPTWRSLARNRPRDRRGDPRRAASPEQRPRADRVGEFRQPRRARGGGLGAHEQVRGRLSRASATTAAASTSTSSSASPSSARRSCSAPSTSTCSRIRARRRTWRCTSRCSSRATRCSA